MSRWGAWNKPKPLVSEMLMPELIRLAARLGVKCRWEMRRSELIEAIRAAGAGR
jgi:hypothetical protein